MALPPQASNQDSPPGAVVIYDMRGPEARARVGRERAAWGRERATIHTLDNDHVVIEFRAGGALEQARA
jgi:hypothetical protein